MLTSRGVTRCAATTVLRQRVRPGWRNPGRAARQYQLAPRNPLARRQPHVGDRTFRRACPDPGVLEDVRIEADLRVKLRAGKGRELPVIARLSREDFIHHHMADFRRGRVAFDCERNSRDPTCDCDAFRGAFEAGVIGAGMVVTREVSNPFVKSPGHCLDRDGNATPETVATRFGATTTGTHTRINRIATGRSGHCPVLGRGILPGNITPD